MVAWEKQKRLNLEDLIRKYLDCVELAGGCDLTRLGEKMFVAGRQLLDPQNQKRDLYVFEGFGVGS